MGEPRTPTGALLRGGTVVDGTGAEPQRADLRIRGGRIAAVGELRPEGDRVLDCTDRLLLPGFVDAHSHAEGQVFDDEVALALLRQGVTTVIGGQDGVSYAPGDGRYAAEYFAAIDGPHPRYTGGGVRALLQTYGRTTPLNGGYLVPAGTVRHEVCGEAEPTATQRGAMVASVAAGMAEGALGLSSGLDYEPGRRADVAELAALCAPVAAVGGIYVSHLRGGYEENSRAGLDELVAICRQAGVAGHVSHFHARSALIVELVEQARAAGVDLTFDSYPWSRGCTILAMLAGPGPAAAVASRLAARADLGPGWAEQVRFAHVPAEAYDDLHGRTAASAASDRRLDPAVLVTDVLAVAPATTVVLTTPHERTDEEMAGHLAHPAHVGGSDGIFIGRATHPRAFGTFARYLATFARDRGDLTVAQVAELAAARPARRFGIGARGVLLPGAVADLSVVDWSAVTCTAGYDRPRSLANGIDDVIVNGVPVLAGGALTGATSGVGLRRKRFRLAPRPSYG